MAILSRSRRRTILKKGEGEGVGIEVLPEKMKEEKVTAMENNELEMEPVTTFVSKREDENS